NLTATAGNAQVMLQWRNSAGATSYNVYRAAVGGGPYVAQARLISNPWADRGVTNGKTYYYVVTANGPGGESGPSNEASATPSSSIAPPPAPTNLVATAGNAQVTLTWTGSAGASSYNVYRSTVSGGPYVAQARLITSPWADTSVTNGTAYYYVVTATGLGGESGFSNQASATPSPAAGTPPPA